MADLTAPMNCHQKGAHTHDGAHDHPDDTDRGQLLVITGLGIALFLVLLALALNTAVFGEVHVASTDGTLREERGVEEFEASARRGLPELILAVNDETPPGYEARRDGLAAAVTTWSDTAGWLHARDGVSARVALAEAQFENDVVHDNESRAFTNRSGETTWTVGDDVENVQHYEINVTDEAAVSPDDCFARDACFNLTVTGDGGTTWVVSIFSKGEDIAVQVAGEGECQSPSPATIDVVNGTLDGVDCFQSFLDDDGIAAPYRLTYSNADNASGTYELVADGTFHGRHYHAMDSGDSPRLAPRVVAANVTVTYRSSELHYVNEILVEPGDEDV